MLKERARGSLMQCYGSTTFAKSPFFSVYLHCNKYQMNMRIYLYQKVPGALIFVLVVELMRGRR